MVEVEEYDQTGRRPVPESCNKRRVCMDEARLKNVLEIAIKKEEEAYDFYMDLQKKVNDPVAKDTLKFLAAEELKHKEFLAACHSGS